MSRREARIERAAQKKLKQIAKSARLKDSPVSPKKVRAGADPGSIFHMTMTWTCDAPDCEGVWSWGDIRQWGADDWTDTILPKLHHFECLTWAEIDRLSSSTGHKMHHNMPTSVIHGEAQNRLVVLEKVEDEIFRFRLGGKPRLWGFRTVANFEILWFDPSHKIYETEPD